MVGFGVADTVAWIYGGGGNWRQRIRELIETSQRERFVPSLTRRNPATHRPERYRAPLPQAAALSLIHHSVFAARRNLSQLLEMRSPLFLV